MSTRSILGVCFSLLVAVAPAIGASRCACVGTVSTREPAASCCGIESGRDAGSSTCGSGQPCEHPGWTACGCDSHDPQLSSSDAADTLVAQPGRQLVLNGAGACMRWEDRGTAQPLERRPQGFRPLLV